MKRSVKRTNLTDSTFLWLKTKFSEIPVLFVIIFVCFFQLVEFRFHGQPPWWHLPVGLPWKPAATLTTCFHWTTTTHQSDEERSSEESGTWSNTEPTWSFCLQVRRGDWLGIGWRSIEDVVIDGFLGCWEWWNPRNCPSIPVSPFSRESAHRRGFFRFHQLQWDSTFFLSLKKCQTWHLIEVNSQPWCRCCIHCIALLSLEHNLTSFQRLVDLTLPKLLFDLFYSEQIDKSSGEAVVLFFANILHSSKQIQSQIMKGADIVPWWKWGKLMLLNMRTVQCEFLNSSQFWCTKSLSCLRKNWRRRIIIMIICQMGHASY